MFDVLKSKFVSMSLPRADKINSTILLSSTGPPASSSKSIANVSFPALRPFFEFTSYSPLPPPRASAANLPRVSFPPCCRTDCTIFRSCHAANVQSRVSIVSFERVQLSQCPQRSKAPVSAVDHDDTDSCDECEKYLHVIQWLALVEVQVCGKEVGHG